MLVGIGENAGVVDVGDGWAVTFKVESHNHPSLRRALPGRGHRRRRHRARHHGDGRAAGRGHGPAALRRRPTHPDTARVLPGVVAGIGGYGNCLGLPNIGGEVVFDPSLPGQPAGQRAVRRRACGTRTSTSRNASGAGQPGRPVRRPHRRRRHRRRLGPGAARPSTTTGPTKRPSVQVGDPFTEKVLIECCLEVFAADLVVGIQDLGGAGPVLRHVRAGHRNGDGGMRVELDRVPLRDATLAPEEILMSESQERMCAVVEPGQARRASWRSARSGTSSPPSSARSTDGEPAGPIDWHGEPIVDVPPRTVAHDGPVYERPYARPAWQDALQADDRGRAGRARRPATSCARTVLQLVASPNLASQVVGHRPVRPLRAGQHRARPARGRRRGPGRRGDRPRRRARHRRQRPLRASSTRTPARSSRWPRPTATSPSTGATPLAVTDCLNFGSPEDPDVMWQFAEAIRGLADGCLELGMPGHRRQRQLLQPDRRRRRSTRRRSSACSASSTTSRRRTPIGVRATAASRCCCSATTRDEFGGSEWAHVVHGHLGGLPPRGRPGGRAGARRRARSRPRATAARRRGHDLSDGGLAQALVESCLRGGVGAPGGAARRATRSSRCSPSRWRARSCRCRRPAPRRCSPAPRRTACRRPWSAAPAGTRSRWPSLRDRRRRAAHRPRGHPPRPLRLTSVPRVCDLSPRHAGVGTACRVTQVANDHR